LTHLIDYKDASHLCLQLPPALREAHAAVFSSVRGMILRFFAPTGVTSMRFTDGGGVKFGMEDLQLFHAKFTPIGAGVGCGPRTENFNKF